MNTNQWPEATFRVKVRLKTGFHGNTYGHNGAYGITVGGEYKMPPHRYQEMPKGGLESAVMMRPEPKAQASYPEIPEGFIPHDGGPCPVAEDVLIEAVFRDGETGKARPKVLHWKHYGRVSDIIAYKPERDPLFKVEAGRYYITASGERVGPMRRLIGGMFDLGWHDARLWSGSGEAKGRTPSDAILCLAADQTSSAGGTK